MEGRRPPTPVVREVRCASVLNRVSGMPFRWSINPYRGCQHACHYCFARATHHYLGLDGDDDWSGVVLAKVNAPEVLRGELGSRRWRREPVAVGTATDPYQPVEGRLRITRGILEALAAFRNPTSLITKGTLVVRDLDVLADLGRRATCTVCVTVPTLDEDVWRRLEPGTPHPRQRLRALSALISARVNAGVLAAPVVPGLTDSPDRLEEVCREAAAAGARFVGANALYLKPRVKEHFLGFLGTEYPALLDRYRALYPGAYAPAPYREAVRQRIAGLRAAHGLRGGPSGSRPAPSQLTLPL